MNLLNESQSQKVSGGLQLISQNDCTIALLSLGESLYIEKDGVHFNLNFSVGIGCHVNVGGSSKDAVNHFPLGNSGTASIGNIKIDFGYNTTGAAYFNLHGV